MPPLASLLQPLQLLLLVCLVAVAPVQAVSVPFSSCNAGLPAPTTVSMDCASLLTDTCVLKKGHTYTLQAEFTPQSPSDDVESYVAWSLWVEMPLLDQDDDACESHLPCPLTPGNPVNFTYPLHIENFWMRRKYPLVWKLRDEDTDNTILCFKVKTFVTS
ncbi:NPC intracellular cholesterol transporter 2 [Chionoecetes opilio]|uniref:NPC intracellular cholesterol transporter 2 n=1 Tax=Chionoecetes opilio TaxID=41210 RepID=A0A8J4YFG5_CHIOP|nr:NPC intracellular cholesterol transporter 2 [Chionoecetes opilio]